MEIETVLRFTDANWEGIGFRGFYVYYSAAANIDLLLYHDEYNILL
jgi:hypothetical protein